MEHLAVELLHQIMEYGAPHFYGWICNRYIYNVLQSNNTYLLFKMIRNPTTPLLPSSHFLLNPKSTTPFNYLFHNTCMDSYFKVLFFHFLKEKRNFNLSSNQQTMLLQFMIQKGIMFDMDLLYFCNTVLFDWNEMIQIASHLFCLLVESNLNIPLINEYLIQLNDFIGIKYKSHTLNQVCHSIFNQLNAQQQFQTLHQLHSSFFIRVARISVELIPSHCIPFDLLTNIQFCKELCKRNVQYAQYFDLLLSKEEHFLELYSYVRYYQVIDFVSSKWSFLQNKSLMKQCCQIDALLFQYLPIHLKQDMELIQIAIQQNGIIVKFVDEKLLNEEMKKVALLSNPMALEYIKIKEEKPFLKRVLRKNGNAYRFLSKKLQQDREMILLGVKYGIETVKWMDYTLKTVDHLMSKLLQANIFSFVFFPQQWKDNLEIAKQIAKNNLHCNQISYCTPKVKQQVMKQCFANYCPMNFQVFELPENHPCMHDTDLLLMAVKNNPQNLAWIIQKVPNKVNETLIKEAVKRDGQIIQYITAPIRQSMSRSEWKRIKSLAFQNDPRVLNFL